MECCQSILKITIACEISHRDSRLKDLTPLRTHKNSSFEKKAAIRYSTLPDAIMHSYSKKHWEKGSRSASY